MTDCRRCGKHRRRGGRGLCDPCYGWARYHGVLDDFPREGISPALIAEEAFHPARPQERPLPGDSTGPCWSAVGRQFVRTAQELGLTPVAARRAYYRARERGLLQEAS
jgi:hypothetical protein